jgi:hypothetical protein
VCDFGAVAASSMFGWVCGAGAFAVVLPTFILVSRIQITTQQYRGNDHFFSTVSSSRHKTMVGGALDPGEGFGWPVVLGVSGATIVSDVRYVDSSTLDFSLSSHRSLFISLIFNSRFLDS